MQLKNILLAEHSRANCERIVHWIGKSQSRFDQLIKLFLDGDYVLAQRAAWAVCHASINNPRLLSKHAGNVINQLDKAGTHAAVKRNTLRLLEDIPVSKRLQGQLMSRCFDYILSPGEKPAVKASALTILGNLAKSYPDIVPELKTIIEEQWDNESFAFRARAKQLLKRLSSRKK